MRTRPSAAPPLAAVLVLLIAGPASAAGLPPGLAPPPTVPSQPSGGETPPTAPSRSSGGKHGPGSTAGLPPALAPPPAAPGRPAPGVLAPNAANLPPTVVPLIQKIEQMPVNSERYSQTTHLSGTVTERKGKHRTRTRHVSETMSDFGEASLSPLGGRVRRNSPSGRTIVIGAGSKIWSYTPDVAKRDGGRPWIRIDGRSAAELFPFHGGSAPGDEVDAGGTGSYAGLVDLLATADGNVSVLGQVTIGTRRTTELTAVVDPLALFKGPEIKPERQRLDVFVDESGLPLRVTLLTRVDRVSIVQTTSILGVNVPVSVTPPPAARTISASKLAKKSLAEARRSSGSGTGRSKSK